jgi:hypothetical protein
VIKIHPHFSTGRPVLVTYILKVMSCSPEIDNIVKKSVLSGIKDKLYIMRSLYISGDNAKGDFLFSDLIDS